jgi:hypothetical protein
MNPKYDVPPTATGIQKPINSDFVDKVRTLFSPLQSEVAQRNKRIQDNDGYIYGNLLDRMLDIPLGHDYTPVNWLRRTVEIHRAQFIGKGFSLDSTYIAQDISDVPNDQNGQPDQNAKQRLIIENNKRKSYAEARRNIIAAINRDNNGDALWGQAAENASAVGDAVIKGWYNEAEKKYELQLIEIVDNFYALWSRDDYRQADAYAYVYQISKENAVADYGVPDDVPTSPLGTPLVVLSSANMKQYVSTQPMVTVMEITGKIEGWKSNGKGDLVRCNIGQETLVNAIIVGDMIYQLIDKPKYIPDYYILPNKRVRREPWGKPDITNAAVQINLTYIEALSDWRTVASKVNFPKFKAYGFAPGVQLPKPKPRTIEMLPLAQGQDIQPVTMGQSAGLAETDFQRQLQEMENQFVREVGISRQLFDLPDELSNSNQAQLTAMKSISDLTIQKRKLWEPIIRQIYTDALKKIAYFDKAIKEVAEEDDSEWFIRVSWPSALNTDDPSYHAMQLNRFVSGTMSLQSFLESMGDDKQELDRIREEMADPVTAAIHGHMLGALAEQLLTPPGPPPPKVSINMRGDMSPEQQANLAGSYPQIANGPFPLTTGPQGNAGLTATDNLYNEGDIAGNNPTGGTPVNHTAPSANGGQGQPNPGKAAPMLNTGVAATPGAGIMSQPGSGAPATSPQGKLNKQNQRKGA